jgi:hypothetical protein
VKDVYDRTAQALEGPKLQALERVEKSIKTLQELIGFVMQWGVIEGSESNFGGIKLDSSQIRLKSCYLFEALRKKTAGLHSFPEGYKAAYVDCKGSSNQGSEHHRKMKKMVAELCAIIQGLNIVDSDDEKVPIIISNTGDGFILVMPKEALDEIWPTIIFILELFTLDNTSLFRHYSSLNHLFKVYIPKDGIYGIVGNSRDFGSNATVKKPRELEESLSEQRFGLPFGTKPEVIVHIEKPSNDEKIYSMIFQTQDPDNVNSLIEFYEYLSLILGDSCPYTSKENEVVFDWLKIQENKITVIAKLDSDKLEKIKNLLSKYEESLFCSIVSEKDEQTVTQLSCHVLGGVGYLDHLLTQASIGIKIQVLIAPMKAIPNEELLRLLAGLYKLEYGCNINYGPTLIVN